MLSLLHVPAEHKQLPDLARCKAMQVSHAPGRQPLADSWNISKQFALAKCGKIQDAKGTRSRLHFSFYGVYL